MLAVTHSKPQTVEIGVEGQIRAVPAMYINDRPVIVTGRWMKVASTHDEMFWEHGEAVNDPELFVSQIKEWGVAPDLFTFAQKITDPTPRFSYHMEWDSFAAVPITTYENWLRKQVKGDVRQNLLRASREGVTVKTCAFTDDLVHAIKEIYDETPVRRGRLFWHYNKSFDRIKRENGTYVDRAEYIGAFFEEELIGFIKMVYVGRDYARTSQVICKQKYFKKRPINALIAKAIEICADRGLRYLVYGVWDWPGKKSNTLTDFKARNGFVRADFPRYYIPLTAKGGLCLRLGLHRSVKNKLPPALLSTIRWMREKFYERGGDRSMAESSAH